MPSLQTFFWVWGAGCVFSGMAFRYLGSELRVRFGVEGSEPLA